MGTTTSNLTNTFKLYYGPSDSERNARLLFFLANLGVKMSEAQKTDLNFYLQSTQLGLRYYPTTF